MNRSRHRRAALALALLLAFVGLFVPTPHDPARAQSSSPPSSLADAPPVQQTIYYVGKETTTDFDRPGMGLHLQYFPGFDLDRVELALPTDCDECVEQTPQFENFKHHQTADLTGRTFSGDAPGVGLPGDPDYEPPGVRVAGGFAGWDRFTLPGGRHGLSGTTRDPASCGNSNSFVNQLRINSSTLNEFCLNIVTDNTARSFDPDLRLEARSDTEQVDLAGHADFTFDGQTDVYTFRYRGMREGDRVQIRIAGSDGSASCLGPGVGGLMISHISTCTPPPGECVPRCAEANGCEDDGCGNACGVCPRQDRRVHREGIVDLVVAESGGVAHHAQDVDTAVRLADSFTAILDDLETGLREEFNAILVAEMAERDLDVRNFFLEVTPETVTIVLSPLAEPGTGRLGLEFRLGGIFTHAKYKPTDGTINTGSLNPSFTVTITAPGIGMLGAYDPVTGETTGPWNASTQSFDPDPVGVFDEEAFEIDVDPNSDWENLQTAIDLFDLGGDIGNVLTRALTGDRDNFLASNEAIAEQFDAAIREALDERLGAAAGPELGGFLRPAVELVPAQVEIGGVDYAPQIHAALQDASTEGGVAIHFDDRATPARPEDHPIVHEDRGRFSLDLFGDYTIDTYVRTTTFPEILGATESVGHDGAEHLRVEGWVCAEELETSLDIGLFSNGFAIEVVRADLESDAELAETCNTDGTYGRYDYAIDVAPAALGIANVWHDRLALIAGYDVFERDLGAIPRASVATWAADTGPGAVVVADNRTFIGDFDGDGRSDHLAFVAGSGWQVARSNGAAFDPPSLWLVDAVLDAQGILIPTVNDGHTYVDDFDGDGRDDLLWYNAGLWVARSNGASFEAPTRWLADTGAPRLHNYPHAFTGDFDGDGRADYVVNYLGWQVALSNGSGFEPAALWLANTEGPAGIAYAPGQQTVDDFDADGRDDFMWRDYATGDLWVARANASGTDFDPPTRWLDASTGDPQAPALDTIGDAGWFVADFDGDARADYMWHDDGWHVARSTGDGFAAPERWLDAFWYGVDGTLLGRTTNVPHQHVADFDGDGRFDYLWNFMGWHVALSSGEGFDAPRLFLANDALPGHETHSDGREFLADFTGDGHVDYLWNFLGWHLAESLVTPTRYLVSAVDSDGDGLVDPVDNCPGDPNPGQSDADLDGIGDACDVACADGLDNDGDGAADFPFDHGCASSVSALEDPECDDGVDNDGDGDTDWPADPSCAIGPFVDDEAIPVPEPGLLPSLVAGLFLLRSARRSPRAT